MIWNFIHSLLNSNIEKTVQVAGIFDWLAGGDTIPNYDFDDLFHEMDDIGIKLSTTAKRNFHNMHSELKAKNFTKAKKSLALITGIKKGKTIKLQSISNVLQEFSSSIQNGKKK